VRSGAPAAQPAVAPAPAPAKTSSGSFLGYFFLGKSKPGEVVLFRHSSLFYWWPVWFFGFVMGLITYFGDRHMAVVPAGTMPTTAISGKAKNPDGKEEPIDITGRDILLLGQGQHHLTRKVNDEERIVQPTIYMTHHKGVGTVFVIILLLVILITNVHMRGLWSFFILTVIVMLSIIFAVAGWWDTILSGLGNLSIHVNMGGYFLLSGVLFLIWLLNFAVFDRQTYMIFTAGQVRMRLEIGGGETVFDTTGMVVQKQRADLFRHWILGFGSGDMVIRPAGVAHPIEMPNVLRVASAVRRIEQLVKEKVVVQG
jgi:hypothetical protein